MTATEFPSLLTALQRRSDAFAAKLKDALKAVPCPFHAAEVARLDTEQSWETGQLVYGCERCEGDRAHMATLNRMAMMGVPERVRGATFENFETGSRHETPPSVTPAQALFAARALRSGAIVNLVLCGTPGVGKGHLAAAVMRARMDAGLRGDRWLTAAKFFRAYHAAYDDGANDSLVGFFARRPLLVLDEMGLGEIPRDGEVALSELFDARWNAARPTIVISNRPPKELTERWLGARVADRLKERAAVLWMAWESGRGAK